MGLLMGNFHHILISACIHSSRYSSIITTRKAYASFKTSVFLRSLNVKDSARDQSTNPHFYRTHVSAKYNHIVFSDPTYRALLEFNFININMDVLFLKNCATKTFILQFLRLRILCFDTKENFDSMFLSPRVPWYPCKDRRSLINNG